jgi:large subunit ribosomal protein L32
MAVPKRRVSKQRKRKRRGQHRAEKAPVAACPHCKDPKLPHRVCPTCGMYRDKQVLEVAEV